MNFCCLFNSDTEEYDFNGFTEQEEDEVSTNYS